MGTVLPTPGSPPSVLLPLRLFTAGMTLSGITSEELPLGPRRAGGHAERCTPPSGITPSVMTPYGIIPFGMPPLGYSPLHHHHHNDNNINSDSNDNSNNDFLISSAASPSRVHL